MPGSAVRPEHQSIPQKQSIRDVLPEFVDKDVRILHFASTFESEDYAANAAAVCERFGLPAKFAYLPNQMWQHKGFDTAFRAIGARTRASLCQSDTSSLGDAEVQTLCRKDDPCGSLSRTNGLGTSGFVCALAAWDDRRVCLMGAE